MTLPSWRFQHPRPANVRGDDHLLAIKVGSVIVHPAAGQRAVAPLVAADQVLIDPFSLGRSPSRTDRVDEVPVPGEVCVGSVTAIEGHALPIEKISRSCGRHTHRVVDIDHPRTPIHGATVTKV